MGLFNFDMFSTAEKTIASSNIPAPAQEGLIPIREYTFNKKRYEELESWFNGTALDIEDVINGKKLKRYPVRFNPIKNAVYKHAQALFGEVLEDNRPLVVPKLIMENEKEATRVEDLLHRIMEESNGRAIMIENAIASQVYGGCVFRVLYPRTYFEEGPKIRVEAIPPKFFIGIPSSGDPWRLSEAWILKPMSPLEASQFGIDYESTAFLTPHFVDYWSEHAHREYVVDSIDGKALVTLSDEQNPYGIVPVVYIPHVRSGGFYGDSLIDNVRGIVAEMNLRIADIGDAVYRESHLGLLAYKNVSGKPEYINLAPGISAFELKSSLGFSENSKDPDMWEVKKTQTSSSMIDFVIDVLYKQFRIDAFLPAVADGEDEGSQRSAETLAARMYPLLSHIQMERAFWTTGMRVLYKIILRMMKVKGEGNITDEHLNCSMRFEWADILPKDREKLVNEVVQRRAQKLGSLRHLLKLLGDIQDIDGEIEEIEKEIEEEQNRQMESNAQMLKLKAQSAPENQKDSEGKGKPKLKGDNQ